MSLHYLSDSGMVAQKISWRTTRTKKVKPVHCGKVLQYMDIGDKTSMYAHTCPVTRLSNLCGVKLVSVSSLSSVSHIAIMTDADENNLIFETEVSSPKMFFADVLPDVIFSTISIRFTFRDRAVTPEITYIPYRYKTESRWACSIPVYSRVNFTKWLVSGPALKPLHPREAVLGSEFDYTFDLLGEIVEGNLVEDEKVYKVDVFTENYEVLTGGNFGNKVTIINPEWLLMTDPPGVEFLVDRDHIEVFARTVRDLCPDAVVEYNRKFDEPPGLRRELEEQSSSALDRLYNRIIESHEEVQP